MQTIIPLPSRVKTIKKEGNMAVFEIGGCFPGYGYTLGNALRRALLSSLPGAAVLAVKIKGVQHEFSTIEHVLENVLDIILNLKQVRLKIDGEEPLKLNLSCRGEKEVKAKDIQTPTEAQILNPELHIATLTRKNAVLEMEIEVGKGLGYEPTEKRKREKLEVGQILIDALFTPIKKVNFEVQNMRVGERTDYNLLRLEIETDGTIFPEEALKNASDILIEQFGVLSDILIPGIKEEEKEVIKKKIKNKSVKKTRVKTKKKTAKKYETQKKRQKI